MLKHVVGYIFWRAEPCATAGMQSAVVNLLCACDQRYTMDVYKEMVTELQRTFPEAKDQNIRLAKASRDPIHDGHAVISWVADLPKKDYPGYQSYDPGKFAGYHVL